MEKTTSPAPEGQAEPTARPWGVEWQRGGQGEPGLIPGRIRSHANTTDFVAGLNSCKPVDALFAVRAANCHDELVTSLRDYLAAQDATKAYMRAIPDGCMPEQNHLGRLLKTEETTEAAARAALAKATEEL